MKILFLSDDFPPESFGGAGIVAFRDAAALLKCGHEVAVITTKQWVKKNGEVEVGAYEGLKIFKIHSNYPERWRAYRSLNNRPVVCRVKKIVAEFKPDVIHAHNIHAHISYDSLRVAKESGAKICMTFHDAMAVHYGKLFPLNVYKVDEPLAYRISALSQIKIYGLRYNPFRNMRIRHYLSYVDKLFAVSDALKQALEENGIKYITVLHNGISVADWQTDSPHVSAFRTTHGLDGKKVILFGGRLSGAKGAVVALQVLKIVSEKVKDAVLLIVGSVDSKGAVSMKKQAEAIGLADKTIFTGWLAPEHMKDAMASSSVVAVLSVYLDPFPTINMEAMACRKPVVGTIFGGTPEIAIDRKTGYIVDPRDVSSVAEKMTDLLEDPKKAGRFGEAGYERVRSVFSMEAHIDALLACYNA